MARTRRRAQRQGWGGGGCPPAPLPPSVWHPPDTSRASLHPEDQEPLGHPGSVAVAEPEPPRWLPPGQHLRVGTSAFPGCPWRHWEGNNPPPFLFNLFFSLYQCSSRGGFSRADTPPGITPPTPVPWHCCQDPPPPPALAQTDRRVGPGCGRDRQRGTGGAALRGLHARAGKCCAGAVTCEPPKPGWGGVVLQVAARGDGGDRSLPAARCRCPGPAVRGCSIFTFVIRWTSVCSLA